MLTKRQVKISKSIGDHSHQTTNNEKIIKGTWQMKYLATHLEVKEREKILTN